MVAPLTSLKLKGFLWYQGESNAQRNAETYDDLLGAMIADWRKRFGSPTAPFLVVQLPNIQPYKDEPTDSDTWPILRESQANVQKLPNVHTVNIIDLGDPKDVHPRNKKDVGYRMSLVARKTVYGENLIHTGPTIKSVKFKDNKATLIFENVGKGLMSIDGEPLRGFALAGTDRIFYWAKAKTIGKNKIELTTDKVSEIKSVRCAWQNNPKVNLYNSEGLPVAPFRTDNWELLKD